MSVTLPMEAGRLAPQQPPMLLLSRLLACDGESGLAEAVLEDGSLALDREGVLLPEALLELMAQAYALVAGFAARSQALEGESEPPRQGMLVGMRHAQVLALPRQGETLQVQVEAGGHFEDFVLVQGTVLRQGEMLAQAELKLYLAGAEPPPLPRS